MPPDELARAKNYVALRFPSGFETTRDISRRLEDALVYHLPDDYFAKYVQNIQAVTAADVQRVAQKYIDLGHLQIVAVGDATKTREVLAKFGSVIEYDGDGKPMRTASTSGQ